MHGPVLTAYIIDLGLIFATLLLLTQPPVLFEKRSAEIKGAARSIGLILLSITFCWSFVVGCLIELTQPFPFE